jgi:hypothetical protein
LKTANGTIIPNATLTAAHLGQQITASVKHLVSGNLCWGTITPEDKLEPTIACPTLTLPCSAPIPSLFSTPGVVATDNCSSVILTSVDVEQIDQPCTGTVNGLANISYALRRVHTAEDAVGNISQPCTQWIYFEREPASAVVFPVDVTLTNCINADTTPTGVIGLPGPGTGVPTIGGRSLLSNTFCELNVTFSDLSFVTCSGARIITRTWLLLDWCNGQSSIVGSRVQTIRINDIGAPIITNAPDDVTISTDAQVCSAAYDLPNIIITDNCSAAASINVQYTLDGVPFVVIGTVATVGGDVVGNLGIIPALPIGIHTFTYTTTDFCGNTATATHRVTVQDRTVPVAVCDKNTVASIGFDGLSLVNASTFNDGSYDNCSPDVWFKARRMTSGCGQNTQFHDQVQFCCADLGKTVMVVFRVYDADPGAGSVAQTRLIDRSNECMVEVQVADKLRPTCAAPANVTVSCKSFDPSYWAYGTATATDNCALDTLTVSVDEASFDKTCNRGTIRRTWTARDETGLTSTCAQVITVTQEQDYFVHFPADVNISQCNGTGNYGTPTIFRKDCELTAVTFRDDTLKLAPDACIRILRHWQVINYCTHTTQTRL